MRNDHCWSHGRGSPSASFQAGSCIARGPRVPRQRHAEHLEHDAPHVVLRLRLGQAERVDLHAVAEPAQLRIGDAVALAADARPTARANARILHISSTNRMPALTKNEIAPDDLRERAPAAPGRRRARRRARRSRRQRERDLLHRRRPGLLQVVRADVDRVPLRHVRAPRTRSCRRSAERRLGREDVRAAREVLLDDVVLRRAAQRVAGDAVLLGERDVQRRAATSRWR